MRRGRRGLLSGRCSSLIDIFIMHIRWSVILATLPSFRNRRLLLPITINFQFVFGIGHNDVHKRDLNPIDKFRACPGSLASTPCSFWSSTPTIPSAVADSLITCPLLLAFILNQFFNSIPIAVCNWPSSSVASLWFYKICISPGVSLTPFSSVLSLVVFLKVCKLLKELTDFYDDREIIIL